MLPFDTTDEKIMRVIKRDNTLEPLDVTKIKKVTEAATKDLKNVSQSELEFDAKLQFRDGISTEEIHTTLIKTAADKIDVNCPEWSFVAARLFLYDLNKRVTGSIGYNHLKEYFERGEKENKIVLGLKEKYDLDDLNNYLEPKRDLQFNYLGVKTLYDRYLLKDKDSNPIELPQQMFMSIAMFLAQNEQNRQEWAKKFYDILSKFEVMCATPTLSNARTPRHQLSSCFIGSCPDNIEGIFDAYKEMALLSKYGGGVGYDFSKVRMIGSNINNFKNASAGVIPFLKIANDIAVAVDQVGCVAENSFVKRLIKKSEKENCENVLISEISIGDYVLSFDTKTGKPEWKEVEETHNVTVTPENQIKIEFKNNSYIITSKWHPMCVFENGKYIYKRSDEIKEGDFGVDSEGNLSEVVKVDYNPSVSSSYKDLTVKHNNNYFCSTNNPNSSYHLIHNTRKGAIAPYIEIWHAEVSDFIDLRKNSGEERRRTHELFPALWICDLFMKRVELDETFTLFDPLEVSDLTECFGKEFEAKYEEYEKSDKIRYKQVIRAKELMKKILTNYFESGMPFLCFKDNANRCNPNSHKGIIHSTNLCTEIFQNTSENKYQITVKLENGKIKSFDENEIVNGKQAKYLTQLDYIGKERIYSIEKTISEYGNTAVCNLASINLGKIYTEDDFKRVIPIAVRMLDNVIDLNFYPVEKAKICNLKTRAIGLGVMGEAEFLASSKIEWGSKEHLYTIDKIYESISFEAIKASTDLSKEKGSYPDFKGSKWHKGILPIDTANNNAKALTPKETLFDQSTYNWDYLRRKIKRDGMRNGYVMAIAPTSSISILVGTTQTIEPIYKKKWLEQNLSGSISNVVPNLTLDTWNYYTSAYDIDQILLVKAAAVRQKYIDQGQSLNIFMALDKASGKGLYELYNLAWKLGLKSCYYLRTESPDSEKVNQIDRSVECFNCQ